MARNSATTVKSKGRFQRATDAVKKLLARGGGKAESAKVVETPAPQPHASAKPSRPVLRQSDVPMDLVAQEYTPPITSSKASFRSDGADHERDQDAFAEDRFNDEDHFTNKSGDPRIGTHRRNLEPSDTRAESRE